MVFKQLWCWILKYIGKWYTQHQLNMFQKWKEQMEETLESGHYHHDDKSLIRGIHRSCDIALSKLQETQFLTNKIQQDVDNWQHNQNIWNRGEEIC